MMEDNQKKGSLTIRLSSRLLDSYKLLCEKKGYDMSKRLRLHIESEVELESSYNKIEVSKVIYKPEIKYNAVLIGNRSFIEMVRPPNVFIIETKNDIKNGDNISFFLNPQLRISIRSIFLVESSDLIKTIECRYWKDEYLDSNLSM